MTVSANVSAERRRRPKDRKAQIARVSAEAFSDLGYHGVSMEVIAGRVGVTAASLYRHYSGKYDLFQEAALALGQQLVDCTAFVDEDRRGPRADLGPRCCCADRHRPVPLGAAEAVPVGGSLPQPRRSVGAQRTDQTCESPIATAVGAIATRLKPWQRRILASAVLSVIGSMTDHHVELADDRVHATLAMIARNLRDTDVPRRAATVGHPPIRLTVGAEAGEYEQILIRRCCCSTNAGTGRPGWTRSPRR